jgi:hypothetical protein
MPRAEAVEEHAEIKETHDGDMADVVTVVTENTTLIRLQDQRLIAQEKRVGELADDIRSRHK